MSGLAVISVSGLSCMHTWLIARMETTNEDVSLLRIRHSDFFSCWMCANAVPFSLSPMKVSVMLACVTQFPYMNIGPGFCNVLHTCRLLHIVSKALRHTRSKPCRLFLPPVLLSQHLHTHHTALSTLDLHSNHTHAIEIVCCSDAVFILCTPGADQRNL